MKFQLLFISAIIGVTLPAQTWYKIPSNTGKKLNTIDFPSKQIGYIGGDDSLLLKSTNGGRTWQKLNLSGIDFQPWKKDFAHLEFIDEIHGYAVIDSDVHSGTLYKTIDGGLHWSLDSNVGICFPKTTFFHNLNNGMVGGAGCFSGETVAQFANGNWKGSQVIGSFNTSLNISTMYFLDSLTGLAAGNSPFIYKTINGGVNWDPYLSTKDSIGITDVVMINDTLAYATFIETGSTGIIISTDGGLTWDTDWSGATFFYPGFNAVVITNDKQLYFGGKPLSPSFGKKGYILQEQNGTWVFTDVDQEIMDVASYAESTVFAVGDSGYIIANIDPAFLSIKSNLSISPFKIYPNPAADAIYAEHPDLINYTIDLIDIQGRVLKSVFNQGRAIFHIDLSTLPEGLFLMRIKTSQDVIIEKVLKSKQQ